MRNEIDKFLPELSDENSASVSRIWNYFLDKYPDAKGSSSNHQIYSGGYFSHIIDVLDNGMMLYDQLSKRESLPFTRSDVVLVLFFHDVEKVYKYSEIGKLENIDNLSNDEIRQKIYESFGVTLSNHVLDAIKHIHGEGKYYQKGKRVMSPLSALCHCADIISARIFFD